MTRLLLIRHGETAWNRARRIQGRTDTDLLEESQAFLATLALPTPFEDAAWLTSPLKRAHETARLIAGREAVREDRLMEMAWGDWEGRTLQELRDALGPQLQENEAKGVHFTPQGGESPAQVQSRLSDWTKSLVRESPDGTFAAVTHKGVIRAFLSLALGWDMTQKSPVKLDWKCLHLFRLEADGTPVMEKLNIPFGLKENA